jgi:putative cardiolipin synthase
MRPLKLLALSATLAAFPLAVSAMTASNQETPAPARQVDPEVLARVLGSGYNVQSLTALTGSEETYNKVDLLHLGRTSKPARYRLLNEAQNYVFITVPYWFGDTEGRRFLNAVRQKRAAVRSATGRNLDVRVMVDWLSPAQSGDFTGTGMYTDIKNSVTDLVQWNKPWTFRPWALNPGTRRVHDKLFVVDGRKLIMGGMNFADDYLLGGTTEAGWHDTDLLIEGPAAQQATKHFLHPYLLQSYLDDIRNPYPLDPQFRMKVLQDLFYRDMSRTWFRSESFDRNFGGPLQTNIYIPLDKYMHSYYFPPIPRDPSYTSPVRLIYDNPFVDRKPVTNDHVSKLMSTLEFIMPNVQSSIRMFVPYLTTTKRFNDMIIKAARRGIKVQIITNSLKSHDLGDINYKSALTDFAKLMSAGVEIYEWQGHEDLRAFEQRQNCRIDNYWPGNTLHTKAIILDNSVVFLGSHNFNMRSELYNSEVMAFVRDPAIAQQLNEVFEYDLDLTGDRADGKRLISCGGRNWTGRPKRTLQTSREQLKRSFEREGILIQFLGLFQAIM